MKVLLILAAGVMALSARSTTQSSTYGQRLVAAVLMGEAEGEGEAGMVAVAEVVRNRAVERGRSPLQVVCQKRAFSLWVAKTPLRCNWRHRAALEGDCMAREVTPGLDHDLDVLGLWDRNRPSEDRE